MPTEARGWTRSCRARCADSGRWCVLPAHAAGEHASGPYRFVRVAAPNQTHFPRADELEQAAFSRPAAVIDETAGDYRRDPHLLRATRERWRLKKAAELAARNPASPKEG